MFRLIDVMESEKERLYIDGEMNFQYWIDDIAEYPLHYDEDHYADYTDRVIDFYRRRIEWIDGQMEIDK